MSGRASLRDDASIDPYRLIFKAIPHNSKCRYCERGAADAKPKAQIILDAAKVSAASGGNSEPKQGQWSQSARGFCPRSTMRVPQPDIIEHFGNTDAVPQLPERCLSRKAGIVRCCLRFCLWSYPSPAAPERTNSARSLLSPSREANFILRFYSQYIMAYKTKHRNGQDRSLQNIL